MRKVKRNVFGKDIVTEVTDEQANEINLFRRVFNTEDGQRVLNALKWKYGYDESGIKNEAIDTHTTQCKKEILYFIDRTIQKEVL